MNDIEKAIKTISDIYDDYFRSEADTVNLSPYDARLLEVHTLLENYLQEKQERDKMVCGNCIQQNTENCPITEYEYVCPGDKTRTLFTRNADSGYCNYFNQKEK